MSRRTRTILFLVVTFLFLVAAPSVVLYTQGYRIDAKRKKVVQTGGISIAAFPKSAQVTLDGKPKKNTNFLSGKVFLQNILPGTHAITVKKEGYSEWRKDVEVRTKQVTEEHNIILWPEDFLWKSAAEDIENYWPSPSGNNILLERKTTRTRRLEIFSAKDKSFRELGRPEQVAAAGIIRNVIWSEDENRIILESSSIFVGDLEAGTLFPLNWIGVAHDMTFYPADKNKIFILSGAGGTKSNTLWIYDLTQKTAQPVLQNTLAFDSISEGIVWLSKEGYLYLSNLSGAITGVLNGKPQPIKAEAGYQIYALNSRKVILRENSSLFFLDPAAKALIKIGDDIRGIKFSPDQRKAAIFTRHEIWVLYLEPQTEQPFKQAGEYNLLTRFSEEIQNIIWIGANHIAIRFENKIKAAEIDDRDGINIIDMPLPENGAEKLYRASFSQAAKQIYILLGRKVFESRKLLP